MVGGQGSKAPVACVKDDVVYLSGSRPSKNREAEAANRKTTRARVCRACGLLVREHGVLFLKLTGDKFCFGDVLFEEVQAGASSHPKTSQVRTRVWASSWGHHP